MHMTHLISSLPNRLFPSQYCFLKSQLAFSGWYKVFSKLLFFSQTNQNVVNKSLNSSCLIPWFKFSL